MTATREIGIRHICLLSSMHTPTDKRVVDKIAVALIEAGFRVTHVCPQSDAMPSHPGLETITYPRPRGIRGRLRQIKDLYRLARDVKADVYQCNEVDSWAVGILLKLRHRAYCVFDVHEHYPSTFAESRFPPPLRPLIEGSVRLALKGMSKFTDRIVLAKRSVRSDYLVPDEKVVLVQNFVAKSALRRAEAASAGTVANEVKRGFRMVHTGLISKVRGWPQMLEALAKCSEKSIMLRVVGEFNDGTKGEFDQRVAELGLDDRVSYAAWMPFDALMQELRASDAGLVMFQPGIQNHVFALPHKMFDYMLVGIPTLVPDFALEVAEIVRETNSGLLVDPTSPDAIAAAADRLARDHALARELGKNGNAAVLSNYNWEAEGERLVQMYHTLGQASS